MEVPVKTILIACLLAAASCTGDLFSANLKCNGLGYWLWSGAPECTVLLSDPQAQKIVASAGDAACLQAKQNLPKDQSEIANDECEKARGEAERSEIQKLMASGRAPSSGSAWPATQGYLLAITMPAEMLFDVKPGQSVSPDAWVLLNSNDDSPPWHHTDLFAKESEVKAKTFSEIYRIEYGWTGKLPALSGQTPARYWLDEMLRDIEKECPTSTVKIITETGPDRDGGSEVIFELNRVGCPSHNNDLITRAMVEARGDNHPVFQFTYSLNRQMTEVQRQHAMELVRSHRLLSKPWPEDQRYMAVKFRVS